MRAIPRLETVMALRPLALVPNESRRPPSRRTPRRTPPLPAQPTALIGRDAELSVASRALLERESRLITFTGPAGVGKTRLALALAQALRDRFPGGVYVAQRRQSDK